MAAERPRLLLDITRTIARARLVAATGIDRVERAYLDWALGRGALFLGRVSGKQYLVAPDTARELANWLDGISAAPRMDLRAIVSLTRNERLRRAEALIRRAPLAWASNQRQLTRMLGSHMAPGAVYLNTGHDNLELGQMAAIRAAGMRAGVLLHDLIPLEHPEYTRSGAAARFAAKLDAARQADLLICNSHDTARRVRTALTPCPPDLVAPLGIQPRLAPEGLNTPPGPARFVCLGTIEPRKNHALLLDIWAGMWRERPPETTPHLLIIGRRGWENRRVFRELDSAPMMNRTVFEYGGLDDDALVTYLATARALLFPSFAEGFGLPLAEALSLGVPAIASDLPALREVGGDVPDWLAPADRATWLMQIDAYAQPDSPERLAQIERMRGWKPPLWDDHFAAVGNALETIMAQNGTGG